MADVYDKIAANFAHARKDVSLASLTTFRIGGPCRLLVEACDEGEISKTLDLCREYDVKYTIMGNGSDILAADDGFDGVALKLGGKFARVSARGGKIFATAGTPVKSVYNAALGAGMGGMEFLSALPASLGGAVRMNAGCFGGQMSDIVEKVWAVGEGGKREFSGEELAFGYRNSAFCRNGFVITAALLSSYHTAAERIAEKAAFMLAEKKRSQPVECFSAGSVFRREGDVVPARLIDLCGLKGFCVGDAAVSEKHAGFIINKGHATCRDVVKLIDIVARKVKAEFGVRLRLEIQLLGSTDDFRRLSYAYGVQSRQTQD